MELSWEIVVIQAEISLYHHIYIHKVLLKKIIIEHISALEISLRDDSVFFPCLHVGMVLHIKNILTVIVACLPFLAKEIESQIRLNLFSIKLLWNFF